MIPVENAIIRVTKEYEGAVNPYSMKIAGLNMDKDIDYRIDKIDGDNVFLTNLKNGKQCKRKKSFFNSYIKVRKYYIGDYLTKVTTRVFFINN